MAGSESPVFEHEVADELTEQVIRGDLKLVKVGEGDQGRMAGVPFLVTSATTGESHTIVTDANGCASTAASWNPHTADTNGGTAESGVWFGGGEPDDALARCRMTPTSWKSSPARRTPTGNSSPRSR